MHQKWIEWHGIGIRKDPKKLFQQYLCLWACHLVVDHIMFTVGISILGSEEVDGKNPIKDESFKSMAPIVSPQHTSVIHCGGSDIR